MTKYSTLLVAATSLTMALSVPATAQVSTYTDQAAFAAATTGDTTYGFNFTGSATLSPSYTRGPVTFVSTMLRSYNDAYGMPYIADNNYSGTANNTFTITSTTSALGLFLGSYAGNSIYSYNAGSTTGTISVPFRNSTTFLGFTNLAGPVSVTFNVGSNGAVDGELDVTQFIAGSATGAVPEPASWAMMILGMGAVGYALRRKVRVSEVKFDAKIKRIAAGEAVA